MTLQVILALCLIYTDSFTSSDMSSDVSTWNKAEILKNEPF